MPHADIAGQAHHVAGMKNVPDEPVALADTQPVFAPGDNPCGILTPMLKHGQRIIYSLIDRPARDYSNYTTHETGSALLAEIRNENVEIQILLDAFLEQIESFGRHQPEPVGDKFAIGYQHRTPPPVIVVEVGKLPGHY